MRTTKLISEIIDEWLYNRDVRKITADNYRRKINLWFRWLSSRKYDPRSATTRQLLEYKNTLLNSGHSLFTANGYMVVIKLFYKYCASQRYCEDIARDVKSNFKMTGRNKLPLSFEQAHTLLGSIDTETIHGKRDKLMIALMLFNGLRTCEVERININDCTTREGVPVIYIQRKGKVDKNDMVVLHDECVRLLEDYIAEREFKMDEPLFITHRPQDREVLRLSKNMIARIIKHRLKEIGIEDAKISAHSLRHTFGSLLIEQGVDIEDVRELMGHSSTTITKIYVELAQQRKLLHNSPAKKMIDRIISGA